ncbi:hypothetical protein G9U51_10685 [Calidifontibacter sp. DB0510]|uniref:Uncharacterized protein n=1 Tax=Metallococcus carri TaxID=1656884 RepID=A0A967B2L3_9MICO|nr:hypothetical protein [Metallococcus carri]NHN56240.1 hypothetical protein [Metallococcus carri]NOP38708.1 hypothetical protein [Calidifontibacter sp. DB2511S]
MTTTHTVRALDATHPVDYLAAIGLLACVSDGSVQFNESNRPVLLTPASAETTATEVTAELERWTNPIHSALPTSLQSTTPDWPQLEPLCRDSWQNPITDGHLRTFDVGSAKDPAHRPLQVLSAALMLVTGKSYLRKSLEDLWPAPSRKKDVQAARDRTRAELYDGVLALLCGERPSSVRGGMALRLTTSDISPRLRSGTETALLTPTIEALAAVGIFHLLPRQRGITVERGQGRRPQHRAGLTWALNPAPLSLRSLVDIHEESHPPPSWPRFTCVVQTIGGGTKAAQFTHIRPI